MNIDDIYNKARLQKRYKYKYVTKLGSPVYSLHLN